MACKEGQFDVVELILKAFSINLNAQHVNGMTHFNLVENNQSSQIKKVILNI